MPSLSMEMLRVVSHAGAILVRSDEAGVQSVRGARARRADRSQRPGLGAFQQARSGAVRIGQGRAAWQRLPADRLRGRLVLIGTSAIGLLDIKTTPVDPAMPGVEVHAEILESVLTKSLLVHPEYAIGAELVVAVLFGLGIIVAAPLLSATIVVALGAVLLAGLLGLSWYFFVAQDLLIDFTYPLISSWLIYLVLTFVNYFREQKQRHQIRSAFGFICRPTWSSRLRARRKSWCSAAKNAA